jgi:flagellar protein FlbD
MPMIQVTRLDGALVYINETNIQWIEKLPDTAVTFLSGARILVKETPEEIALKVNALYAQPQKSLLESTERVGSEGA